MTEDFSKFPPSISEIRSGKTGLAADASPRDVLVSLLRDIDSGILKPEVLVVCFAIPLNNKGGYGTQYRTASPSVLTTVGLLASVSKNILG